MNLYGYIPGINPEKHILISRRDGSLGFLAPPSEGDETVRCYDIFTEDVRCISVEWFDNEFRIDQELEDLVIDLNKAGFRTAGCCRGKWFPEETTHIAGAYVNFREPVPGDVSTAIRASGFSCYDLVDSPDPARLLDICNWRVRIDTFAADGTDPNWRPSASQIETNVGFEERIRQAFGSRVQCLSAVIRRAAAKAL